MPNYAMNFSQSDVDLLVKNQIIPKNTPPEQINYFLKVCELRKLNPFLKQIHLVARKFKDDRGTWQSSYTIQSAIDGMRAIAQRNIKVKRYERGVKMKEGYDLIRKEPVKKLYGFCLIETFDRGEYYDEACFDEYCQRKKDGSINAFWKQFPETMIKKVAEESVLRMVSPEDLSGIYGDDEMLQADNDHKITEQLVEQKDGKYLAESSVDKEKHAERSHNEEARSMFKPTEDVTDSSTSAPPKDLLEKEITAQFKDCKAYGDYLALWNKLNDKQKTKHKERFVKELILTSKDLDQLLKVYSSCDDELRVKLQDRFDARRGILEANGEIEKKKKEPEKLNVDEYIKKINSIKDETELNNYFRSNLKAFHALDIIDYEKIANAIDKRLFEIKK